MATFNCSPVTIIRRQVLLSHISDHHKKSPKLKDGPELYEHITDNLLEEQISIGSLGLVPAASVGNTKDTMIFRELLAKNLSFSR